MIVIGLGHRARAGKDTVADHLCDRWGFKRYALADLLKKSTNMVMGWDDRHSYGELKEVIDPVWNLSPRQVYQRMGTEGWRAIVGETVWATALRIQIQREGHQRVVITDVRFKQGEVPLVKELGGKLWKVDRPGLIPLNIPPSMEAYLKSPNSYSHQSEWDLVDFDGWDSVITNDSSIKDLHSKVDYLMKRIFD